METKDIIAMLHKNRLMRSPEEVTAFDRALAALPEDQAPTSDYLYELFMVFDDRCEHQEVMWGLLHFIESFDDENFFQAFIKAVPDMVSKAAEWVEIFHARILNSDASRDAFKEILSTADSASQNAIRLILKKIASNEPPPLATHALSVLSL
jgi:hypothetical protein